MPVKSCLLGEGSIVAKITYGAFKAEFAQNKVHLGAVEKLERAQFLLMGIV